MKKVIIFDLDGTLAESKSRLTEQMTDVLVNLCEHYYVAIISGGAWQQFEKQVISELGYYKPLNKFIMLPTSGAAMYRGYYNEAPEWVDSGWGKVYDSDLTLREKWQIYTAWTGGICGRMAEVYKNVQPKYDLGNPVWGEIGEDRGSQVTFSMLGQDAPLEEKKKFDPDQSIRKSIVEKMSPLEKEYEIRIGGTTSIDVTRKGIDKAFGIRKLFDEFGWKNEDALFIGDAIFPGGNDYPAKEMGLDCIKVNGPDETLSIIDRLIKEQDNE